MSHAAAATRHGAVAVASKQALTSAGPCEPGDVLGAVAGDVVIVGSDLEEVAIDVVARLLSSGGEIVTVIGGADAPPGLAESLGARIERGHRDVEVSLIDGGQPHYPLLLGVE
jgi:dihydroxyacetone kinase-like predicted kinase